MQTCQAAAGLTLRRLPFSPWANQTELWEGHPRLWCLCRRGNSAWQLLAFRQQPVFMEIIPPYSRCSRLLLITARMKTKLSYSAFFFFFSFFFTLIFFLLTVDSLELAQQLQHPKESDNVHPALKLDRLRANINLELTFVFSGSGQKRYDAPVDASWFGLFSCVLSVKGKIPLWFLFLNPDMSNTVWLSV